MRGLLHVPGHGCAANGHIHMLAHGRLQGGQHNHARCDTCASVGTFTAGNVQLQRSCEIVSHVTSNYQGLSKLATGLCPAWDEGRTQYAWCGAMHSKRRYQLQ